MVKHVIVRSNTDAAAAETISSGKVRKGKLGKLAQVWFFTIFNKTN